MQIEPYEKHFGRSKRQPFQFSLRTLMLVTAGCAAVAAIVSRWGALGLFNLLLGLAAVQLGRGIWTRRIDRAAGGGCALLLLMVLSVPLFTVVVWDGSKTIPLQFDVVDVRTGTPIRSAIVRIRHVEWEPAPVTVPPGEPGVQGTTDRNGKVVVQEDCWTSGHQGILEDFGLVHFNEICLVQVTADGYVPLQIRLHKLAGIRRDIDNPYPPPQTIRMVTEPVAK